VAGERQDRQGGGGPRPWGTVFAFLLFVGAGVTLAVAWFPEALADEEDRMRLTYLVALLAVLVAGVSIRWLARPGRMFYHAAIWVVFGALLMIAYELRHDVDTFRQIVLGEPAAPAATVAGGSISFPAARSGHFLVVAEVDGQAITFLVDTGSTDVVLTPRDARRLGMDPDKLAYTRRYLTANGEVRGAPVRLGRVRLGPIDLADVRASVNEKPMPHSLLGMTFLNRLDGYEVSRDRLTLRP